jgi:hypothetical protein
MEHNNMSNRIIDVFSNYINWLVVNYQSISKLNSSTPPLKLISCEKNQTTGETQLVIQVSGKNLFPRISIQELAQDSSILKCFHAHDQVTIQKLLPKSNHPATHKIVARTYDRENNRIVFTIEYEDEKCIKRKAYTHDIYHLGKHIHLFDREDAFLIGLEMNKIY